MFGELNEKQEEYLKDIYASGTHLLSLINDILDLSKIEAGRMELELTDFDLPMALDNALMLVRERAQRRSLTLHKDVHASVGQIQGDERKIRQVVLNLLSNAIKFTPRAGRSNLPPYQRTAVWRSLSEIPESVSLPRNRRRCSRSSGKWGQPTRRQRGLGWG